MTGNLEVTSVRVAEESLIIIFLMNTDFHSCKAYIIIYQIISSTVHRYFTAGTS